MRSITVSAAMIAMAQALTLAPGFAAAAPAAARTVKAGVLVLSSLQIRAAPRGLPTTAAYLTVENPGKAADALVEVRCGCAGSAMVHRTETRSGVSSMSMVGEVDIPAGGTVSFSPSGLHVMLVGLKGPLVAGKTQVMTLTFKKAGRIEAPFRVVDVVTK